jgi:NADP-dependent 3-hydroxy acid dehydrogenase YdfG
LEQQWSVFITGGSEGIGYACAVALLERGHKVCIVSRSAAKLEAARKNMAPIEKGHLLTVPVDVTQKADVDAAVTEAVRCFGGIDVLINAAGVSMHAFTPFESINGAEYDRIIRTNTDGVFYVTQAVLAVMRKNDSGYILNILSTAAYHAGPGNGPYSASKYAARAMTETLVEECRGSGIRISSISPGPVATTIWSHKTTPPSREKREKMLQPSDIADLAVFLLERSRNVFIRDIEVTPWYYS